MNIYLPIAEQSVNLFLLLGLGGIVGILSGLFGVGGGFLTTPLLLILGVPPAVAVATQSNQIIATSTSGVIAHWRRGNVDFMMGFMLMVGGLAGSAGGVWLFSYLQEIGQIDLVINLSFVILLGFVGTMMLIESLRTMMKSRRQMGGRKRRHYWIHSLPLKMRFRKSGLYVSALLPIAIGALVGLLVAIMGVGGGFLMVPAMIYIIGMPTVMVIGTSLFQIIFVAANVTMLQASTNHTVDIILAIVLMAGGTIGAQYGARVGARMKGEQLRILLSILVLCMATKIAYDMVVTPDTIYSILTSVH